MSNYTKFINFGNQINKQVESPFNSANPLTYCLFPTLSSQFTHGSTSSNLLYGTYNPSCELYMAERCATNWDSFCNVYVEKNPDDYYPNNGVINRDSYLLAQTYLKNNKPTVGEMLVRNAVNLRFLDFPTLRGEKEPFDPNVANSPMITYYRNNNSGISIIKKIENVNENIHVHKMLENQAVCFDVLARLYLGYLRGEKNTENFKNSKLEKLFLENQDLFNNFIRLARHNNLIQYF